MKLFFFIFCKKKKEGNSLLPQFNLKLDFQKYFIIRKFIIYRIFQIIN